MIVVGSPSLDICFPIDDSQGPLSFDFEEALTEVMEAQGFECTVQDDQMSFATLHLYSDDFTLAATTAANFRSALVAWFAEQERLHKL